MADLTQTAANVKFAGSGVNYKKVQYGESVSQGMPLYLKAADGKYWQADADTVAEADAKGIAVLPGSADGWGLIVDAGPLDIGATLTVGETYAVSTNVGKVAPIGDLTTGDTTTILGTASAAGQLDVNIYTSGVAKP